MAKKMTHYMLKVRNYIYDNVNSQDKELLKFEKSGHLMTYGDHAYRVEQSIIQFFSK